MPRPAQGHSRKSHDRDRRYEDLRACTIRQVAQLMAASAITARKSGGQLFLAGKPNFMETGIADGEGTRRDLAAWMRARGNEGRERIWFRDACGYATCAEFLHCTKTLRGQSAELEFAGPVCNLRDVDLGIAVGSAAKTAAIHSIDCRCQTRVAVAACKTGLITPKHAVALSLSMTRKAIGLYRLMPEADFDSLDFP
jgi:uncharacterized ferredoxin-like protein